MKKLLERFSKRNKPIESEPRSAVDEPITTPREARKPDRFPLISWTLTLVLVAGLLGSTLYYKSTLPPVIVTVPAEVATEATAGDAVQVGVPGVGAEGSGFSSIFRALQLKTRIPERPRYETVIYRVSRGDAMLRIAESYGVKTESILFSNPQLEDNPHNLKPGMELTIPPVDGLYYEWRDGDTFESIADKFDADADEIIAFPGNDIDLTNPIVPAGRMVMVPGGSRELRNWAADLQTAARGANTGTGGNNAANTCGGGPVGSGFGWPANSTAISGNGYGPGHLGIDIQANEGDAVYAAASGIVTMAQGGWNYGYGNVIQIDHGNGYVTVYAHLSVINVGLCTPVGQGAVIGAAGNTGNSFGAHLHFEVRLGGTNINPYQIVQ
jgi:murein DD-endopeptidase MepM/ murein hydrolase activator NlpD